MICVRTNRGSHAHHYTQDAGSHRCLLHDMPVQATMQYAVELDLHPHSARLESTACSGREEQAKAMRALEDLQRSLETKEAKLSELKTTSSVLNMKANYDRVIAELAAEKDELAKEMADVNQVTTLPWLEEHQSDLHLQIFCEQLRFVSAAND